MNDERSESATDRQGKAVSIREVSAGFCSGDRCGGACTSWRAGAADARRKTRHRHEHDAAGVPRLDRSIDPGQRIADDRPGVRRRQRAAVGDHLIPDRRHRAHAALREIRRYPRPARLAVDRAGDLHGRRVHLGIGVQHADADLRPGGAGHGRRRHDFERPDGARRHGAAQGARPNTTPISRSHSRPPAAADRRSAAGFAIICIGG